MIEISFDKNANRFTLKCHPAMNEVPRKLPNRRFSNKLGAWLVPALAGNVRELRSVLDKFKDVTKVSPAARDEIMRDRTVQTPTERFPAAHPFLTQPFEHQLKALDRIWPREGGALFMEQGTGKSKVAVDWVVALMLAGKVNAVVIICPVSVKRSWVEQFQIHCPMQAVIRLQGHPKVIVSGETIGPAPLQVLICGTESLSVGLKKGRAFDEVHRFALENRAVMVVDESHLIKSHDATRSKNVHYLSKLSKHRLILTGTPIAQGLMDLFSQFEFLDPDILGVGDFYSFRNRYAVMGGYENKQIVAYQNTDELMQLVAPHSYECRKKDVLDLPEKLYQKRFVKLTATQEEAYKRMKRDKMAGVDLKSGYLEVVVQNILTVYQHLQTIASGFMYVKDDADELPKDSQVIIWARYRFELDQISKTLEAKGLGKCALRTGGMSEEEKAVELGRFRSGECRFFVSSQAAGGTGLTLNEASTTIYFSNTFSLIDRVQSEDRNHRIGQKNSVLYVDILAEGTVDEHILQAIADKKDLADYVRGRIARGQDVL
jgi:SNF2 family DNA or RNA helicase